MFEAGCIHFEAFSSTSTRPVSSDVTLIARFDETNSGRDRISRTRARNSSKVLGGAVVDVCVGVCCAEGVGVGVGVCFAAGVGVAVGEECVRAGVGVGVAFGGALRRSRVCVCASAGACGASSVKRRSSDANRERKRCGVRVEFGAFGFLVCMRDGL